jgi:hypothetical protein
MKPSNLKIELVSQSSGYCRVKLTGDIDETADFSSIPSPGTVAMMDLDLGSVRRINSTGTKAWIQNLTPHSRNKTEIRYFSVPSSMVEQFNQISNFACSGKVETLALPFLCGLCGHSGDLIRPVTDAFSCDWNEWKDSCPKCGQTSYRFDEIPEAFFDFLK